MSAKRYNRKDIGHKLDLQLKNISGKNKIWSIKKYIGQNDRFSVGKISAKKGFQLK